MISTILTLVLKRISTPITLTEVINEAPETYTFTFKVPANIDWAPGSYAHFLCSDLGKGKKVNNKLVRELSIMTNSSEQKIGFTTRIRKNPSEFKQALLNLNVGDNIRIFKIGNHFKTPRLDKPIVFISMGVGIATFRPLILQHLNSTSEQSFITNINIDRSGCFVYKDELDKIPGDRIKNVFVTNRGDLYKSIDACISGTDSVYFIVGSDDFNKSISDYLVQKNVAQEAIILDKH